MNDTAPRMALALFVLLCTAPAARSQQYAVVVHSDCPTADVTRKSLARIFRAEKQHWSDNKRIYLALPKSSLPEFEFLLKNVYRMSQRDLSKHWVTLIYQNKLAKRPTQFASTRLMLKVVEKKKGAIAIVRASDLPEKHAFKVLTVDSKGLGQADYPLVGEDGRVAGEEAKSVDHVFPETTTTRLAAFDQETSDDRLTRLEDELAELQYALLADDLNDESFFDGPLFSIKGFTHFTFQTDDVDSRGTDFDDEFALGGLDLFITSQLSENVSFLNETVFEPTTAGENVLDVERVILKYDFSDAFNLQAGRFHTSIGNWNETFHHGEWLQTSVGRPAIFNFEDENGLLPLHSVGLLAKGSLALAGGGLNYTLEIANGRGPTPDPPQIAADANDHKAVNVAVAYRPAGVEGLRLGASYYFDRIPVNADVNEGPLHGRLDEDIYSLFFTFACGPWEALAEYIGIDHDGATGSAESSGYFVQVSRRMGAWTPYVRYQGVDVDDADTYFASVDDLREIAVGSRYDLNAWSSLKLQYNRADIEVAGGADDEREALLLQLSFAF